MLRFLVRSCAVSVLAVCATYTSIGQAVIDAGKLRVAAGLDRTATMLDHHVATDRAAVVAAEPLSGFPSDAPLRALARSVGLLWIDTTGADGKTLSSACTAAVIAPNTVITNAHCVRPDKPGEKFELEFWLEFVARDGKRNVYLVAPEPLEIDDKLDYALLRLVLAAGQVAPTPQVKPVLRTAEPDERLLILYHTGETPLVVTRTRCRATAEGRRHDLRHTCATRPGSSGSLVIAERDHAIVGLHRAIRRSDPRVPGIAISAEALAEKSAVLRTFMVQQTARAMK